jgi:hypothetical protein
MKPDQPPGDPLEQVDQLFPGDRQRHRWNEEAAVVCPDPALTLAEPTM